MHSEGLEIASLRKLVGTNVRRLRKHGKLTQAELAVRVGMGWRHLQKIEAGEVNITLTTISRFASVLAVPAAIFLIDNKTEMPNAKD